MATYKVIQDIEAEDKLIGPLTLKQFIFAAIAAAFTFVTFMIASKTVIWAAIPFVPFILVPAILAAPLSKEQPTDIWLAARIRFFIKPRKRTWDQSGLKELVTITAPKKVEKQVTNGLNEYQVKSRLKALARTVDSRGWAVKNIDINLNANPNYFSSTDRLIDPTSLPVTTPEIEVVDIHASDDILDAYNNPTAQHLDEIIKEASAEQKQRAINMMHKAMDHERQDTKEDHFVEQPAVMGTPVAEPTAEEENKLLEKIHKEKSQYKELQPHHKSLKTPRQLVEEQKQAQAVTPQKNPDIVNLANTNELKVASLAKLANRKSKKTDEVVINLH